MSAKFGILSANFQSTRLSFVFNIFLFCFQLLQDNIIVLQLFAKSWAMCPDFGFRTAPNIRIIQKTTMTAYFDDMTSLSIFFDVVEFALSSSIAGPSLKSIPLLVLEL